MVNKLITKMKIKHKKNPIPILPPPKKKTPPNPQDFIVFAEGKSPVVLNNFHGSDPCMSVCP